MTIFEEAQLKTSRSLWRQTTIGTWICIVFWTLMWLASRYLPPPFGYVGWEGGPRIEFIDELDCWHHLMQARKTNPFLNDKVCDRGKQ
jgi:hypothetical protein